MKPYSFLIGCKIEVEYGFNKNNYFVWLQKYAWIYECENKKTYITTYLVKFIQVSQFYTIKLDTLYLFLLSARYPKGFPKI